MSFPIQFSKESMGFNFVSPMIDLAGNGAMFAVGGISLAAITYVAFKSLGLSTGAASALTAIPVSIGVIGVAGFVVGMGSLAYVVDRFARRM